MSLMMANIIATHWTLDIAAVAADVKWPRTSLFARYLWADWT